MFNLGKDPSSGNMASEVSDPPVERRFPYKLHDLLSWTHDSSSSLVVTWQPHGRAFKIHNADGFLSMLKSSDSKEQSSSKGKPPKFSSFLRNLNLWGFKRLYKGADKGCYYHEFFVKGHRSLCSNIHRKSINGNRVRQKTLEDEPDYYYKNRYQYCYFDDDHVDKQFKRKPIYLPATNSTSTETIPAKSVMAVPNTNSYHAGDHFSQLRPSQVNSSFPVASPKYHSSGISHLSGMDKGPRPIAPLSHPLTYTSYDRRDYVEDNTNLHGHLMGSFDSSKENRLQRNEERDDAEYDIGKTNHCSNVLDFKDHELTPLNSNAKVDCFGPKDAQILLSVLGSQ